jgi:hypothetical protein
LAEIRKNPIPKRIQRKGSARTLYDKYRLLLGVLTPIRKKKNGKKTYLKLKKVFFWKLYKMGITDLKKLRNLTGLSVSIMYYYLRNMKNN